METHVLHINIVKQRNGDTEPRNGDTGCLKKKGVETLNIIKQMNGDTEHCEIDDWLHRLSLKKNSGDTEHD